MRPPPPPINNNKMTDGIEKPRKLSELPRYVARKVGGFLSRLFYIISLVWESSPWLLVTMAVLCLVSGLLPVIGAYISRDLLNAIAGLIGNANDTGSVYENLFVTLRPILFLFVLWFIHHFLNKVLTRIDTMVNGIAGELVVNHIKLKIINKSKTVDLSSFDNPEFYAKLENANREASMRPISILTATFKVISALISVASFIAVLAMLSPIAPLVVIVAAIPGAIVNYIYRKRNFGYIRRHSKERREMNYYSDVMVDKDLAKEIKILGAADTLIDKYKKVFKGYFKGLKSLFVKEGIVQMLVSLLTVSANCALFVFVAYNVIFEGGQIGDYSLYTGALSSIASYVTTLVTSTATIYEGTLFINNMMEFMNEERTVVSSLPEPRKPARGVPHTVEFQNVTFRYPGTSRDILKNVSVKLSPSESVVLVGLNGAGKTTMIKLLTRLYDPTEGRILLDGVDLREYEPEALYSIFGIVFQDFGRYSLTVEENIRFGDIARNADADEVREAAKRANADGFINELPLAYDTPLTRIFEEEGIELSGGQWQKISVARAFFKESEILILDEPTAALDALAEQEVFRQFAALSKGKITLFVSHRLSSAVDASKIILLDGGQVAEEGTHEELMALGGKYHMLFTTQASKYQSRPDGQKEEEM